MTEHPKAVASANDFDPPRSLRTRLQPTASDRSRNVAIHYIVGLRDQMMRYKRHVRIRRLYVLKNTAFAVVDVGGMRTTGFRPLSPRSGGPRLSHRIKSESGALPV